jgi:hypothetical protein
MIREQDGIFVDFYELDDKKKIEVLIKIYYFTKEHKDEISKLNDLLNLEKEELAKKNEAVLKDKEDSIKLRVNIYIIFQLIKINSLKLENECLKNEMQELKKSNITYTNENETLKNKIKDIKKNNITRPISDDENLTEKLYEQVQMVN